MDTQNDLPPVRQSVWRMALRLGFVAAVALIIHGLMDWVSMEGDEILSDPAMLGAFLAMLLAYAILIAIPFVPGIEIGLTLLIVQGAMVAPFVWAATVIGLSLAFSVGHWVPYHWIHGLLADLRLKRACAALEDIAPLTRQQRIDRLKARLPAWAEQLAGKGRYVLLALLINLPGSAVIGGGGGIAFVAGLSKLYSPIGTLLVIAVCVAPVPLAVWLWGKSILTGF